MIKSEYNLINDIEKEIQNNYSQSILYMSKDILDTFSKELNEQK